MRRRKKGIISKIIRNKGLIIICLAIFALVSANFDFLANTKLSDLKGYITNEAESQTTVARGEIHTTAEVAAGDSIEATDTTGESVSGETDTIEGEALTVYFIDVGQGDCQLLVSDGMSLLIDCGEYSEVDTVKTFLDSLGITKLDYCIATHPHSDHIGGMGEIISTYQPSVTILPEATNTSKAYEKMIEAIGSYSSARLAVTGDSFILGNTKIEILFPTEGYSSDNLNNYSVVTKATVGEVSILFTGDIESDVEGYLVSTDAFLNATVLKVAHHGSNTSSSNAFINAVNAKYSVIQVGLDNEYGHPTANTLSKLTGKILRTDEKGSIILKTDGENIVWLTER